MISPSGTDIGKPIKKHENVPIPVPMEPWTRPAPAPMPVRVPERVPVTVGGRPRYLPSASSNTDPTINMMVKGMMTIMIIGVMMTFISNWFGSSSS